MAYGSHTDAYDGGLYRSFREPLPKGVRAEELRPLRYLYLGQWQCESLYAISAADPER